jgi:hypothetical protein
MARAHTHRMKEGTGHFLKAETRLGITWIMGLLPVEDRNVVAQVDVELQIEPRSNIGFVEYFQLLENLIHEFG